MDEDKEYLKLSVEDRCQHKLWKARVSGYEEAKKIFERIDDEKSPEFSKYLGLIKKFVIDSNAVAQEKGLDAALAFIENAACAGKTVGEVSSGVVQKCIAAPKTKTREKGSEIILMFVEIEKFENVQEELVKGLENKSPKVVAACIHLLTEILRNFGHKVLSLKPLVKLIPKLLEDRDKNVREETKQLTIEIYRWIGAPIKPQLQNLKPVQLTELENEFEKLGNEKPQQIRYLKSQQGLKLKRAAVECEDEAEDDEDEGAQEAAIDPFDLMDPVDILSKLPKDFYDKCEAKKWQERKEAMETLHPLTSNPKLESGDYADLVRALKKIIAKDTNIMVIALAGKCITGLASGLKKKFQPYAASCIPVILDKFKEKKPTVLQPMREASDAVYNCTTLDVIMEDLLTYLQNKNPSIRAETLGLIGRVFSKSSPAILTKKILKMFCAAILTTLNDADGVVRDNSAVALGTAMKVVGEKAISPFLQDVDGIKMGKINECCEKAEVTAPKPAKAKVVKAKEPAKPAAAPAVVKPARSAAASADSKKSLAAPKEKAVRGKGGKKKTSTVAEKQIPTEKELSKEEAIEVVESLLPPDVVSGLSSSNWKERLAAMEKFSETIQSTESEQLPTQALIIILKQKPGFKDTNFQVLNLKFSVLNDIASKSIKFSQTSANCCMKDIIDKIGDIKAGANAMEALSTIAEATSLKFVSSEAIAYAFTQKNPKNQIEAINWLAKSIKEFGFQIDLKPMITYTKQGLAATNPAIRTSCITLISTIYLYVGQVLRTFYEDEKPALLQQIDAEFEKVKGTTSPPATRGLAANSAPNDAGNDETEEIACPQAEINVADLIPRTDFGSQVPSSVINDLADKNWKVRAEALDKLKSLLAELKFITPNLGDLPTPLKLRLSETNKNLLIQFLGFTENLSTALGPGTKQHVRHFAPAIFTALGDNKNTVRAAALSCLNTWVENASFLVFIDGEMMLEAFKPENPFIRTELLGWLAEGLNNVDSVPSSELSVIVPTLYTCIEDRSADVRKKAQDAVLPFMIHLGCESMVRAANKLKPGSKPIIMGHIEKAKANLPAKPTKVTKSSSKKKVRDDDNSNSPPAQPTSSRVSPQSREGTSSKRAASKTRKPEPTSKSKKKEEEVEIGPALPVNNMKDQRMADEKALKVLRWNFTAPREEFYDQLKDQMCSAGFSRTLQANMFHADFKYHLKAIETLNECVESCPDGMVSNVDLILKWMSLRFFDTNPSVLLKGLEYLQQLFNLLVDSKYHLSESDASSFIPYLILKVGDPKDPVRKGVREIFKLLCKVYPSNRMFSYLMQGLSSKNARQRTECLEELGSLIETYGMSVCQPSAGAALKEIAKQISDRDNSVRNAALNCVVQAYFIERDKVYKLVGHLADKDMSLLEERIKRASKNRPPPSVPKPSPETKVVRPAASKLAQPVQQQKTEESDVYANTVPEPEVPVVKKRSPPRPVMTRPLSTGPFTLDLDSIEQMVEGSDSNDQSKHSNLVTHDLGEIYESIPSLPKTRSRPPSPAQKVLNMSSDAASTMDLVISQIASNNIKTSICALSQIDELLHDAEKAESMVSRVDQLLVTVALQYRMVYNRYMSDPNTSKYEVIKLYRTLTMTVFSLLHSGTLAKAATTDILRDLIYNLLTVLLDSRLNELDEGPQLAKSINLLMVKIMHKCDCTNAMSALIRLLQDCVGSEACSVKFTELVMKCVWKMVRMFPNIIDDLDLDRILYDIHVFLKHYPFAVWKERSMDTPLRTVKTVLHTFAKLKGNKILSHRTLIEDLKESELDAYLHKALKSSKRQSQTSCTSSDMNSPDVVADARNATRREVKTLTRGLSKNTHEILAEIFKKIGSKENTKEGLSDLYDFKQKYPDADIEPFLRKSSQFFQSYIERGLKTIEQEKNNNTAAANINLTQISSQSSIVSTSTVYQSQTSASTTSDLPAPSVYMERLKVLRAKCGMDNSKFDRNIETITKPSIVPLSNPKRHENSENTAVHDNINSNENGIPTNRLEDRSNLAFVESIRKRLEATKAASKS